MNNFYTKKKVLLVGASGHIGSCLAPMLLEKGATLTLAYHHEPVNPPVAARVIVADIATPGVWEHLAGQADIVFYLAAHESGDHEPELDLQVNTASVLHLLETCRLKKWFPRIVFASSSNLVGAPPQMPVDEDTADNPLTLYAITKLAAERYLRVYARDFEIPSITLRLANVYGPAQTMEASLHATLNKMIRSAVLGNPLKLFANKAKVRDFLFIDDAAAAFVAAGSAQHTAGDMYVVGSETGESFESIVGSIAEEVYRNTGRRPEVLTDEQTQIETVETRDFVANSSRFIQLTGWRAQIGLTQGIQKTIDYFSKYAA